jgi:hypothetical protein
VQRNRTRENERREQEEEAADVLLQSVNVPKRKNVKGGV